MDVDGAIGGRRRVGGAGSGGGIGQLVAEEEDTASA